MALWSTPPIIAWRALHHIDASLHRRRPHDRKQTEQDRATVMIFAELDDSAFDHCAWSRAYCASGFT